MMYAGDPLDAFYRYDSDQAEAQERFEKLCPTCLMCGNPITDEHCYCLTSATDEDTRHGLCIHTTCEKIRPIGRNDKMDEVIKWLIEEVCYTNTPFKEEEVAL